MAPRWLLYGATGYTGTLIAHEAVRRGLRPVLAGRNPGRVAALAESLGLDHVVFDLLGPAYVKTAVAPYDAVLHCAGPFVETYKPMVDGCIAAGRHYLDITGEIAVFEGCFARDAKAREAGVVLLPGVGFDVVPSDCLAATLKARVPNATSLTLAFGGGAGMSRGTAATMLLGAGYGGAVRRGGRIVRVPLAWKSRDIPFRDKSRHAVTIPWGDVSTAFRSTGIPDIAVYTAMPRGTARWMRLLRPAAPLLAVPPIRRALRRRIETQMTGPTAEQRARSRMQLWGEAIAADGTRAAATLTTPEGYAFTALAAVECVERLLAGGVSPGAHTPSTAFGAGFVTELPDCQLADA